jgi:hypothetical protein
MATIAQPAWLLIAPLLGGLIRPFGCLVSSEVR